MAIENIKKLVLSIALIWATSCVANNLEECLSNSLMGGANNEDVNCYVQESNRLEKEVEDLFSNRLREIENLPDTFAIPQELKTSARRHFIDAQINWRAYKDAECKFEADSTLGTGRSRAHETCKINLARIRLTELRNSGF